MALGFLSKVAGRTKQLLGITSSSGSGDANKLIGTNAAGKVDITFMPDGIGPDALTFTASETLAAGNLINLWDDSGTVKMRKADASSASKEAHGYVLAAVTSGATGTAYFDGTITGLSGLTKGATYLLSDTAGGVLATSSAPSGSGKIIQEVGVAISDTELVFEKGETCELT